MIRVEGRGWGLHMLVDIRQVGGGGGGGEGCTPGGRT